MPSSKVKAISENGIERFPDVRKLTIAIDVHIKLFGFESLSEMLGLSFGLYRIINISQ